MGFTVNAKEQVYGIKEIRYRQHWQHRQMEMVLKHPCLTNAKTHGEGRLSNNQWHHCRNMRNRKWFLCGAESPQHVSAKLNRPFFFKARYTTVSNLKRATCGAKFYIDSYIHLVSASLHVYLNCLVVCGRIFTFLFLFFYTILYSEMSVFNNVDIWVLVKKDPYTVAYSNRRPDVSRRIF